MGIGIQVTEIGKYAPVISCDVCGKIIEDGGLGMVRHLEVEVGERAPAIFCHKGECDAEAERKFEGLSNGWLDLRHVLVWIVKNSKIDWEEASESAGWMEKL